MGNVQNIMAVAVIALVTFFLRSAPFLVFGGKRPVPKLISHLSEALPPAIMAMLVVYCLRNVSFVSGSHAIPEIIALLVVSVLHVWKRNTILSISVGTIAYMMLVQTVF